MTTPAIHATGLRKAFRTTDGASVVAVDDVDLTVQPGEIVAFLGPNGAGKTTTVDMLLGLTSPDAGTIEVYGATPAEAASKAGARCASRPPIMPASTSPDPAVARSGGALSAIEARPSGIATTVSGPLRTTTAPERLAASRARSSLEG